MQGLWVHLSATAEAGCPAGFRQVQESTERAFVAYEEGKVLLFQQALDVLLREVACLEGLLEPPEAVQLHLLTALNAWVLDDQPSTAAALAAVLAIDPGISVRAELGVTDLEFEALVAQVKAAGTTPAQVALPLVPWTTWRVDGVEGRTAAPVGRPTLLQLVDTRDARMRTFYLLEGGLPAGFDAPDAAGAVAFSAEGGTRRGSALAAQAEVEAALTTEEARASPGPRPWRLWASLGGEYMRLSDPGEEGAPGSAGGLGTDLQAGLLIGRPERWGVSVGLGYRSFRNSTDTYGDELEALGYHPGDRGRFGTVGVEVTAVPVAVWTSRTSSRPR